jgi:hypothetical protein
VRIPLNAILCAVGLALLCGGGRAADAYNPTSVTWDGETYEIVSSARGEAVVFDISSHGSVIGSIGGSTDMLCDQPYLRRYAGDLVVYSCGRYHAYTLRDRELVDVPYPGESLWTSEIEWRGLRLEVLGLSLLVFAMGRFASSRLEARQIT